MGLTVNSYSKLFLAPGVQHQAGDGLDPDKYFMANIPPGLAEQAGDIEAGEVYRFAERREFQVGYSAYNEWREWLAGLSGVTTHDVWNGKAPDTTPCRHLIAFPDNEGVLGTEICALLAREMAGLTPFGDAEFVHLFHRFRQAFVFAAADGCVAFE